MQLTKWSRPLMMLLLLVTVSKSKGQMGMEPSQTENQFFLLDLIFLLDGSSSVGAANFELVKSFVIDIASQFNISDGSTQIGVIQYSRFDASRPLDDQPSITTEIALGNITDPGRFKDSVEAINLQGFATFTASALNKSVLDFSSSRRFSDPSTTQVLVLFTDGESSDSDQLPASAAYVRSLGIETIAVGVSLSNVDELKEIATGTNSDEGVYSVHRFQDLSNIVMDVKEAIDVNECENRTGSIFCQPNSSCFNTVGSFLCQCNVGYIGNRTVCYDVDECANSSLSNCHSEAECTNLPGSFQCSCRPGFTGDGRNCSDINECSDGGDNCHSEAACFNTFGSFRCQCNTGFFGDGATCTVIVDVQCLSNYMSVTIVAKYLTDREIDLEDLHFRNTSCTGNEDEDRSGFWVFRTGLSDCSTKLNRTEPTLIYSNVLNNVRENGLLIGNPVSIAVRCEYTTEIRALSFNYSRPIPNAADVVTIEAPAVSGEFEASLDLFTDATFEVTDHRTQFQSDDTLFVQATLNTEAEELTIRIESCWTTPDPSGTVRYTFIENGCPVSDANDNIKVTSNGVGKIASFESPVFAFIDFNFAFLQCSLEVCSTANDNVCSSSCTLRRKRSLRSMLERQKRQTIIEEYISRSKVVSIGPFIITKGGSNPANVVNFETGTESGLSVQALTGVVFVCIFIAVISIAFAAFVLLRPKRSVQQSQEHIAFENLGLMED